MSGGVEKWKSSKKVLVGAAILIVGGLVFGAFRLANSAVNLPTTEVKRKEFVDYLEIKGEIKAIRSAVIAAPYSAGDLQILKLVANATKVKKGDVLVEFDATTVRQKLAEDQSAVKSAEAEIQQSRAGARLKEEQDLTDVMTAKTAPRKREWMQASRKSSRPSKENKPN
jgi:HlyD family secretion protein